MTILVRHVRSILICGALAVSSLGAAAVRAEQGPKQMYAVSVDSAPLVDGKLDDPAWQTVSFVSDFVLRQPREGAVPSRQTRVAILYDRHALYVGARMATSAPGEIDAVMTRHDNLGTAERLIVSLDTFHNHRTAYSFAVTAAGGQADWYHSDDSASSRDLSFDPVWTARTAIDETGWTAEIRIPLTQLRFSAGKQQIWGININRYIPRYNEDMYWLLVPRDATGWASYFGELRGLEQIHQPIRLELWPYLVASALLLNKGLVADENPFAKQLDFAGRVGLDLKAGLGPSLTLDATINPDFGQAEADPAEVNLSGFETFFDERRPFFIEGNDLLEGQASPLFYSRRIGEPPRGSATGDYIERPTSTPILGAAKLTGRLPSGLSIGSLAALTGRTFANTYDLATDTRVRVPISPLTAYTLIRLQQDLGRNASRIGASLTGVHRDLEPDEPLARQYVARAYTGGLDGVVRFADAVYEISGFAGFSHIQGQPEAITAVARNSVHYFQRPDQDHVSLDPNATSMSGLSLGTDISKRKGSWQWLVSSFAESPGLDTNDIGRLRTADDLGVGGALSYRQTTADTAVHTWETGITANRKLTWGGVRHPDQVSSYTAITWRNFWTTRMEALLFTPGQDPSATRGGPLLGTGWGGQGTLSMTSSDAGRMQWEGAIAYGLHQTGEQGLSASGSVAWRPSDRLWLALSPRYRHVSNNRQYLATVAAADKPETFDQRYVFSTIERRELAVQARMQLAFNPTLAIDFYAEPFVSSGRYTALGELPAPRSRAIAIYGRDLGTIERSDAGYALVVDGQSFMLTNPDFTVLSLRSTLILRWEFMPGSTMFLIWQQTSFQEHEEAQVVTPLRLGDALAAGGEHTLAIKLTYWWPALDWVN